MPPRSRSNTPASRRKRPTLKQRMEWAEWEMSHLMAPAETLRAAADLFQPHQGRPVLVAEGDSWFDYPPGYDVIKGLRDARYNVHSISSAGATVEQMVYGPDNDQPVADFFRRDPSQLAETLRYIRERRPDAVLFSGGGNDLAGDELLPLLNHKNAGGDPLRAEMVEAFYRILREGYRTFLSMVRMEARRQGRTIPVLGHSYDYAFPDGRGVVNLGSFHFIGPWLLPSLNRKGYTEAEGKPIVARLIDRHHAMLVSLAAEFPFFHPVDLRGTLPRKSDWANELHPTNHGFRRVVRKFTAALRSLGI
jgi:hypothetical protein